MSRQKLRRDELRLVREPRWLLLATVGFLVAVVGAVLAYGASHRTDDWNATVGRVAELRRSGSGQNENWDTTILFQDTDGIEYQFDSQYGSPSSVEDSRVTVMYPAGNPQRAQTSTDAEQDRAFWIVVMVVGLAPAVWSSGRAFWWWGGPRDGTSSSFEHASSNTP